MTVPFVTQQGNGVYNDCGPACVAMLAKWLGRVPNVAAIAAQIDTQHDGTTGWDVGRGLGLQGLTATYVSSNTIPVARAYPFVQLVWYPNLPHKAPGYEAYANYHWILRLADDRYHDPLFPNDAGASLVGTKTALDAAYRVVTSGPSIVGITERPMTEDAIAYDAEALVEWTVRDLPGGSVSGVFVPGAKFRVLGTVTDDTGKRWAKVQRGAGGALLEEWNGTKRTGPVLDYAAEGAGWRKVVVPIPPAPTGTHRLGVHTINDGRAAEDAIARGAKAVVVCDAFLFAYQLATAHPGVLVFARRTAMGKLGTVDEVLRALEFNTSSSYPSNLIFLGFNEGDSWGQSILADRRVGMSRTPNYVAIEQRYKPDVVSKRALAAPMSAQAARDLEARLRLDVAVNRVIRTRGAQYAAGSFSMGTPQLEAPDVQAIMRKELANAYNNEGIWYDMHSYSPRVAFYEFDPKWFSRRWAYLFTDCGFDPKVRHVCCTETGVDEGGVGGFVAHKATPEQFATWCVDYLAEQGRPVTVGGVPYPSPVVASTFFQSGQNTNWAGYDVRGYLGILEAKYWK